MTKRHLAAACLIALALAGCARKLALEPAPGESLPVAPTGRDTPLTSEELLALPPLAAPERNIELRSESEVREDDPFDLPPEG
jgi:hypothetical protein